MYVRVNVFSNTGPGYQDYVAFDTAASSWSRIARHASWPQACLGESQLVGLVSTTHEGTTSDAVYSAPAVVTYDAKQDAWTMHPLPGKVTSNYGFTISCADGVVVVNANPDPEDSNNQFFVYSLATSGWKVLPATPVFQYLSALKASAGQSLVSWNLVGASHDPTPISVNVGSGIASWTKIPALPLDKDDGVNIGLLPYGHAGTHVVAIDDGTVMAADVSELAKAGA